MQTKFQSLHAVNLDGFPTAAALQTYLSDLPSRGIPRAYRLYAHHKAIAMRARERGDIPNALLHEEFCDDTYTNRIPSAWRW
jgi:hypothetical protein